MRSLQNDLQDILNINGTSMLEIASLSSVDSDKQGEYK